MRSMSVLDRLAALSELASIPREQLQWLLDHGEIRRAEVGATFRSTASSPPGLLVLIEGRCARRSYMKVVDIALAEEYRLY